MSTPEVHQVRGTTFHFPELPPCDEISPLLFRRLRAQRDTVVLAAQQGKVPARLQARNTGTIGAALSKLAGTRNPVVKRPASLGEAPHATIVVDDRRLSYWSAGPRPGEFWMVDVVARTFVLVLCEDGAVRLPETDE